MRPALTRSMFPLAALEPDRLCNPKCRPNSAPIPEDPTLQLLRGPVLQVRLLPLTARTACKASEMLAQKNCQATSATPRLSASCPVTISARNHTWITHAGCLRTYSPTRLMSVSLPFLCQVFCERCMSSVTTKPRSVRGAQCRNVVRTLTDISSQVLPLQYLTIAQRQSKSIESVTTRDDVCKKRSVLFAVRVSSPPALVATFGGSPETLRKLARSSRGFIFLWHCHGLFHHELVHQPSH